MPAVDVSGLTVRYGPSGTPPAVVDLSLSVERGEVLVLLGPNGAGKTTTVEVLEGYRRPAAGRVEVLGHHPIADHAALASRMGVMLQRGGVYPMLAPRRVLRLFAGYYREPRPTEELLELVGLTCVAGTPWRHLSGGEQQRLSLALALVGRPEVAFLDEPTAGVDPEGRIAVRAVVAELKSQGVGILLTTHELGEAEQMADRIAIISAGCLVREGSPRDLTARASDAIVSFGAPRGLDTVALASAAGSGARADETAPGRYRVEAPPGTSVPALTAAVTAFLAGRGTVLTDLVTGRTLEDVYLEAVAGAPRVRGRREEQAPSGPGGPQSSAGGANPATPPRARPRRRRGTR